MEVTNLYRVVLIGDPAVGKTSIVSQTENGSFDPNEPSTVGAMFILHQEQVDGQVIEMQIWDTAGQERFRSLGPIYYRNASAAVVVFDITRSHSFDDLDGWIKQFTSVAPSHAIICIVANKSDLMSNAEIPIETAKEWAKKKGYLFHITSAKTGEGIPDLFKLIAQKISTIKTSNPELQKVSNPHKCC